MHDFKMEVRGDGSGKSPPATLRKGLKGLVMLLVFPDTSLVLLSLYGWEEGCVVEK